MSFSLKERGCGKPAMGTERAKRSFKGQLPLRWVNPRESNRGGDRTTSLR